MSEYVYVEYPKCLYRADETVTVHSREEEDSHANDGWLTAEEFHAAPRTVDPLEVKKKKK